MLSVGELATIVEHGLPLTICVFNDRGYGAIRMVSDLAFGREIASDLVTPDFVALAQSMGIEAVRVHSPTEFAKALDHGATSRRSSSHRRRPHRDGVDLAGRVASPIDDPRTTGDDRRVARHR